MNKRIRKKHPSDYWAYGRVLTEKAKNRRWFRMIRKWGPPRKGVFKIVGGDVHVDVFTMQDVPARYFIRQGKAVWRKSK